MCLAKVEKLLNQRIAPLDEDLSLPDELKALNVRYGSWLIIYLSIYLSSTNWYQSLIHYISFILSISLYLIHSLYFIISHSLGEDSKKVEVTVNLHVQQLNTSVKQLAEMEYEAQNIFLHLKAKYNFNQWYYCSEINTAVYCTQCTLYSTMYLCNGLSILLHQILHR